MAENTPIPAGYQPWPPSVVAGVADVLGETSTGLTGSEIGYLMAQLDIPDRYPAITKRHRLREALLARQAQDGTCRRVVTFITDAMAPVRYRDRPDLFTLRQDGLNEVLVHVGLRITDEGKVARGARASTLSEAARHANTLRTELRRRGTHPRVLRYCTREILAKNAFHAMLEATKSVADQLRAMTGVDGDGAALVDATLTLGQAGVPRVAINTLSSQTERDEQKGLANLIKGVFGMYRNPTAHDPRINRPVSDDELLELLTTLSMIHRRLDHATVRP
jgi:uncharacterized protein (TIGR02391 family)